MRASVAVLGPLIGRFGQAKVAMPGGCQIGSRKLDMHILGLEALGVNFDMSHGYIHATVPKGGMKAAHVTLEFASVGATENLMMAATCAEGSTIIENAAREPEICDLADFLNQMGARISGQGTSVIEVHGSNSASFAAVQGYATVADRIEAGSFLVAGALTGGPLTVAGVNPAHLAMPLEKLRAMGAQVDINDNTITVAHEGARVPADIQTLPYPGFPTDLQPQFMVLNALADGTSSITENIFENRFMFADELNRMGAQVRIEGHHAIIKGVAQLSGAPVQASDLRAGAGLVLAGLVADGETCVGNIAYIDRGYDDLVGKLRSLGADICYR
jgi:UDP-N-acetylglucosamine 1-carboxyvinyltransferase